MPLLGCLIVAPSAKRRRVPPKLDCRFRMVPTSVKLSGWISIWVNLFLESLDRFWQNPESYRFCEFRQGRACMFAETLCLTPPMYTYTQNPTHVKGCRNITWLSIKDHRVKDLGPIKRHSNTAVLTLTINQVLIHVQYTHTYECVHIYIYI